MIIPSFQLVILGIAIFSILFLLIVVYWRDRQSATSKSYALLSLTMSAWLIASYLSVNPITNLLWARITIFSATLMSMLFFLLSRVIPEHTFTLHKKTLVLMLVSTGAVMLATLTPLVFRNVEMVLDSLQLVVGPGIGLFASITTLYTLASIFLLIRKIRKASAIEKSQLHLVLAGIVSMIGLLIVTVMIPVIFFQHDFFVAFIPIYALVFLGMTAYAIVKHHLFDIKVIATEAFAVILWIILGSRLIVSNTGTEILINAFVLGSTIVFGILLVKAVRREVKQRETLEILSKELQAANVKLREADKMKSQFLSFASHQVKSPMTVVKDYAELIKDGSYGEVPEKVKETATKIHDSADRLIALVNNLLDLRKLEEGKVEYLFADMDINALVKNIFEDMKTLADAKGLQMTLEAPANPITIKADTEKIRQVIQNLIDNSVKYTEHGYIRVKIQSSNVKIQIIVEDSGIGIPQDLIPSLFEQFNRGSVEAKKIQGTGLGLYIAKKFVEAHHGRVWAESKGPGKGSMFTVELTVV